MYHKQMTRRDGSKTLGISDDKVVQMLRQNKTNTVMLLELHKKSQSNYHGPRTLSFVPDDDFAAFFVDGQNRLTPDAARIIRNALIKRANQRFMIRNPIAKPSKKTAKQTPSSTLTFVFPERTIREMGESWH